MLGHAPVWRYCRISFPFVCPSVCRRQFRGQPPLALVCVGQCVIVYMFWVSESLTTPRWRSVTTLTQQVTPLGGDTRRHTIYRRLIIIIIIITTPSSTVCVHHRAPAIIVRLSLAHSNELMPCRRVSSSWRTIIGSACQFWWCSVNDSSSRCIRTCVRSSSSCVTVEWLCLKQCIGMIHASDVTTFGSTRAVESLKIWFLFNLNWFDA